MDIWHNWSLWIGVAAGLWYLRKIDSERQTMLVTMLNEIAALRKQVSCLAEMEMARDRAARPADDKTKPAA